MTPIRFEDLRQRFEQAGQGHVFRFWDKLNINEREQLLTQAASIDLNLMAELWRRYILSPQARYFSGHLGRPDIIPLPATPKQRARARVARERGEEALRTGQVGVVLVAGGQGSRLGWHHPKGTLPIGPVSGKSLFQLHAEKLLAISRRVNKPIPWYIMTSETTHEETISFFHDHNFFGLPGSEVNFFAQRMIPALDAEGRFFLAAPHRIFTNPDGHGGLLRALGTSGILEDMTGRGLKWLFYFQVDNVLVKMCDPTFLGYHLLEGAEASAKVLRRRDGLEKMGIPGKIKGRAVVVEYSDLPPEKLKSVTPSGRLRYWAGSIGIHVFNVEFLQRLHDSGFSLPYHVAHKKIPYVDEGGRTIQPEKENGYKFEQFIFDVLPHAEKVVFMEVAREEEFSPIKNETGVDSPETARRDLISQWSRWLEMAGCRVPRAADGEPVHAIEISPLRALDAEDLAAGLSASFDIAKDLYLNS